MPLPIQRSYGVENRSINALAIRAMLTKALANIGLTDADGQPLHYTPLKPS